MLEFLSNSWIVSIITGLIVYIIGRIIEGISNKRRYNAKLASARNEIFSTIKTMVPEESMPPLGILKALHRATAKRYQVKEDDLDSLSDILENLIKEILDTNFLAYEEKLRYSDKLQKLIEPKQFSELKVLKEQLKELGPAAAKVMIAQREYENIRSNRRLTHTSMVTILLSLIATMVSYNWSTNQSFEIPHELSTLSFQLMIIVGVLTLLTIGIAVVVFVFDWLKSKKNKRFLKRDKK